MPTFAYRVPTAVSFMALLVCATAFASPPGESLTDQVKQAYDDASTYDSTMKFVMEQKSGRWLSKWEATFHLRFDRSNQRLCIDSAGMPGSYELRFVVKDGKAYHYTLQFPGHHVETDAPDPLDMISIVAIAPWLAQPVIPDAAFLLSEEPIAFMTGGVLSSASPLAPDEDDEAKRPRLQYKMHDGTMTMFIDPKTKLIDEAVYEMDTGGASDGDYLRLTYDFDVKVDQRLPDDAFDFDTSNSTAHANFNAMTGAASVAMGGGQGGPPLLDAEAPDFELQQVDGDKVKLSDVEADIIILDFWATWCGPCIAALPKLQEINNWAKESDKSVVIYAVNMGDTPEDIKPVWEKLELDMPVLLDTDGGVGQKYGVVGIPHTVIIANGKVKRVYTGYDDAMVKKFKKDIEDLLAEQAASGNEDLKKVDDDSPDAEADNDDAFVPSPF